VDVENANVEVAESVQIRSDDDIVMSISEIVARISSQIEIVGTVTRVDGAEVYTSLGKLAGVEPEEILSVLTVELIRDESGKVIMREEIALANIIAESVSQEGSRCKIIESAFDLEVGSTVRPGKMPIQRQENMSGLEVRTVPDHTKVFLDGKFLGLTPVMAMDIEPGTYLIEIRSGEGYETYKGKVNLRPGRTVTLERELEPLVEVEDILLFGKIPRKQTDPKQALKWALVPGLGAVYNGYPGHLPIILTSMGIYGMSIYGFSSSQLPARLMSIGIPALIYSSSLVDAYTSAKEDFLYPTYMELSLAATGILTQVPEGQQLVFGLIPELIYEGRSILFHIGFFAASMTGVELGVQCRFLATEHFFLGLGTLWFFNFAAREEGDAEAPPVFLSPALSLSYKTAKVELDVIATPYAHLPLAYYGDRHLNLIGIRVRSDFSYFLTLKTGITVGFDYSYLKDTDESSNYTMKFLIAKSGIILRL
jgi:hypothetical protein